MTNVYLNDEVIWRVDGTMFLDRFCLRVVENGCGYLDCRDSQLRYCGRCMFCSAFDDSLAREFDRYSELEVKFETVTQEVTHLESITQNLSDALDSQHRKDELTSDLVHSLNQRNAVLEANNSQLEIQVRSLTQRLSQLQSACVSSRQVQSPDQV